MLQELQTILPQFTQLIGTHSYCFYIFNTCKLFPIDNKYK